MKRRFKILTFLLFASFISLLISYTQASTVNQVKEQIIQTANLVGDKYVEAAEYLQVPKPMVPIIPMLMPLSVFVSSSIYVMHHSASRKKPTKFYVLGACGNRVECRFSREIRSEYVKAHLSLGCSQQFDSLTVEDESKSTMLRNVARLCRECGEDFERITMREK